MTRPAVNIPPVTIKGVCLDGAPCAVVRHPSLRVGTAGWTARLGESFSVCLSIEIAEETGLTATVEAVVCTYQYEVLAGRWVNLIMYGSEIAKLSAPVASSEHRSIAFVDLDPARGDRDRRRLSSSGRVCASLH